MKKDLKLSLESFLKYINENKFVEFEEKEENYTSDGYTPVCPLCKDILALHEVQALHGYVETLLMLGEITYEEIEGTTEDDTLYYCCLSCDKNYKMANPHYPDFLYF